MPGEQSNEEWVLHNTRIRKANRRALELLVLRPGLTYQGITDDAIAGWLQSCHPEVLAAIGDPEAEAALAGRYAAERISE